MKIEQAPVFQPITITLETHEEALHLWDLANGNYVGHPGTAVFAANLSSWFSNCAQLGGDK